MELLYIYITLNFYAYNIDLLILGCIFQLKFSDKLRKLDYSISRGKKKDTFFNETARGLPSIQRLIYCKLIIIDNIVLTPPSNRVAVESPIKNASIIRPPL